MEPGSDRKSVIFDTGRILQTGDVPLYGATPIDGVPEGLRSVFKGASDGHRILAIEADFRGVSVADLSVERCLRDFQILEDVVNHHPDGFANIVSSLHQFERLSELARDTGLRRHIFQGDLMTGAVTMARVASAIFAPGQPAPSEQTLAVSGRRYVPVAPVEGMSEGVRRSLFLGCEERDVPSILITPDALAVSKLDVPT